MDIRNKEQIEPIFEGVDYVFHFAALADIVPSIQRPWDYYSSKKQGKKDVAYDMLCYILDWEDKK